MFSNRPILEKINRAAYAIAHAVAVAKICHQQRLTQIAQGVAAEEEALRKRLDRIAIELSTSLLRIERESTARLNNIRGEYLQNKRAIVARLRELDAAAGPLSESWSQLSPDDYAPAGGMPEIIRFGELSVSGPFESISTPAWLHFAGSGRNVILKAAGPDAKTQAAQALQSLILRLLLASRPSRLRLLLIDPVGLGQNLAAFIPSRDFLERLADTTKAGDGILITTDQFRQEMAGGKVWTEAQDIEKRLEELSGVLEDIVQENLRNLYADINEYNLNAGDFAKPYRLVSVVNFPVGFSENAARRLVSICSNGPRCGVYTILTWDTDQKLPYNFNPADLESTAHVVEWDGKTFVWRDPDYSSAGLELDRPPETVSFERYVQGVWTEARRASRIVLPFTRIAPAVEERWQGTTAEEIRVPIGLLGAKGKQVLELDHRSYVHALITGQTGSGKSNLLHMLISSLAIVYPPDELQMYLIDFKEGVGFKSYAPTDDGLGALPHARAIAIHSEREFGLSVLKGLVDEMRRRGEAFKAEGVQDIAQYRRKANVVLPRILLLVDEFQVFFEEDDQISEEAKLCLDQLVSQSRSSGIHMILSSQTLERTRSLPASTIGQMAVRIALKASTEADSIKMVGNKSAYHLERQGEAVYNPMNGLIQGNTIFQIPYMPDEERSILLREVKQRYSGRPQPIVFDGNRDATVEEVPYWHERLSASAWPPAGRKLFGCLGPAVAIKAPTAATFFHQPGRNLLIVGKDEQAGVGMLCSVVCDLAAQLRPGDARFYLWNLLSADSEFVEAPDRLAKAIASWEPRLGGGRDVGRTLSEVSEVLDQRLASRTTGKPEIFIVAFGGHRARDLVADARPRSSAFPLDEPPRLTQSGLRVAIPKEAPSAQVQAEQRTDVSPAASLMKVLREGPEAGVYFLGWWDNYQSVIKTLDRNMLREFGMRVALTMGREDSRNLIDEPDAARLRPHRSLYWDDDNVGRIEKFIPFAPPRSYWLNMFEYAIRSRA